MRRSAGEAQAPRRSAQGRPRGRQACGAERAEAGKRAADRAGVELSAWEGEFLGSVADRVSTYGRAFGDPEKGAAGEALSALQARKLREIAAKAKGEAPAVAKPRAPLRRRSPKPPTTSND